MLSSIRAASALGVNDLDSRKHCKHTSRVFVPIYKENGTAVNLDKR